MRTPNLTATLIIATAATAYGQVEIPRKSPAASVSQVVGTTRVAVDYHRPGVRGRRIFGGLLPYGELWRFGANNATKLTVDDPVEVAGEELAAGSYALFAIPGDRTWTIVINQDAEQWGTNRYDEANDVHTFEVPARTAPYTEWLTFELVPHGDDVVELTARWERTAVSFLIEVDVSRLVWRDVLRAVHEAGDDPATLRQAARWAEASGERLEQGLRWIDRVLEKDASHWNLDTRARLLWRLGRAEEAAATMRRALELAKGNAPEEFHRTRGALLRGYEGHLED